MADSNMPFQDVEGNPMLNLQLKYNTNTIGQIPEENPDEIQELPMEEIDMSEPEQVYRPCTESLTGKGPLARSPAPQRYIGIGNSMDILERPSNVDSPAKALTKSSSSWSVTKLFRDHLLYCCRGDTGDNDLSSPGHCRSKSNVELENLMESPSQEMSEDAVDKSQGCVDSGGSVSMINTRSTPAKLASYSLQSQAQINGIGPIWILDYKGALQDPELEGLKCSGDIRIHTLVIRNPPPPSQYIVDVLNVPLVTENVTILNIENYSITVKEICMFIEKLTKLEQFRMLNSNADTFSSSGESEHQNQNCLMKDFKTSCEDKEYFAAIRHQYECSMECHPQRLKVLIISLPTIWQCGVVCKTVEALMENAQLEVLKITTSLSETLKFLVKPDSGIVVEEESTWKDLLFVGCEKLLVKNREYLRQLSITCADKFPLEYLQITNNLDASVEDIFRWCFYCTSGILESFIITNEANDNDSLFSKLSYLYLNLPFVPVPMLRYDELRGPLNRLVTFLAKNNHVHQVTLLGLRPEKAMENWIKHSLVTIPRNGVKIGCTYTSTTLGESLPAYDDELISLAFVVVPEETRKRVSEIVEPNQKSNSSAWRYTGLKCLHVINQLPTLLSFDVNRMTSKFSRLTILVLEDYVLNFDKCGNIIGEDGENRLMDWGSHLRSLTDADMQAIFKNLLYLEYLHLECNMTKVTDYGLTGISDSLWCRLTQRDKVFSFWFLYNLKYVYLRGFGEKVTDKSAIYAFSEEYSLKNLQELHVFAPGFTNYGKDKIRRAFADRKSFTLSL